ncbi:hypothetical protein [Calidithermus chliarophilus]|uniref:hypothetical protein n=1 Tax=Calidithermus chliarophilus TaxID=52023 RepID=UPI0004007196|nr:hypothetical protein [Calidithermus chliarophilus]
MRQWIRNYYARALARPGIPWLVVLGACVLEALAFGLMTRQFYLALPGGQGEVFRQVFGEFLARVVTFAWVPLVFMFVAGFDNKPFAVFAHSSRLFLAFAALMLLWAWLFPVPITWPLDPDRKASLITFDENYRHLVSSPGYLAFRLGVPLVMLAQVFSSYIGLQVAGAYANNARWAVIVTAAVIVVSVLISPQQNPFGPEFWGS